MKSKGDIEEIVPNVYYLPMNSSGVQSIICQMTQPIDDRGGAPREPKEMMIQTVFFRQDGSLLTKETSSIPGNETGIQYNNFPNIGLTEYRPQFSVLFNL